MDNLPFADENLESEAFKEKCDELSEAEALNYDRRWGRWYVNDGMLSTWVTTPQIGVHVVQKLFEYQIILEELKSKKYREDFIEFMQTKKWMGDQGIHDLRRALKSLFKNKSEV